MNEKSIRNKIQKIIKEVLEEELEENLYHATPTDHNVVMAVNSEIEAVFPNYSEETKEFIPKKVIEKQY